MPAVISADGTRIGESVTGRGPTLVSVGGALMYRAIDECHAGMTRRPALLLHRHHLRPPRARRPRRHPPYAVQREIEASPR